MTTTTPDSSRQTELVLDGGYLTASDVEDVARRNRHVALGPQAREKVASTRSLIDDAATAPGSSYGVNTGVGKLVNQRIQPEDVRELQLRVVRSHSAGVGEPYPPAVVRAAMLLRAATLSRGHSGVRPEVIERLLDVLNAGVLPHVPARGSVGASGDLAPLSHMALCLVGEGDAWYEGTRMPAAQALEAAGVTPLALEAKEGLALVNGTQFMTAMGALTLQRAWRLARVADLACALSTEALRGSMGSFDPEIHALRPHPGQIASADNILRAMSGSTIAESHRDCSRVQDAYALRCAPQVHGAARDSLTHAQRVLEIEYTAVTDNPLVFDDEPLLRSGGNFHGEPIAIVLDLMAIAIAELASIAERRIERLVNPAYSNGLPAFLVPDGGLNSGYMLAQYTAAALVSENKVLCHPASVDSIPTSAGQEDHVSMGNHGGLKLLQVIDNAERVLAIELLCAAQGVEFQAPRGPGAGAAALYDLVRTHVPPLVDDRVIGADIDLVAAQLRSGTLHDELTARLDWELA